MTNAAQLQKLIVVEDDPDIQIVIEMALVEIGGFEVQICGDANQLYAALEGNGKPDLILLDVMLPDKDGPTIIAELASDDRYKDIPVIFATARVRQADLLKYNELGAIGTLSKPYDIGSLCDQITEIWSKARDL